MIGWEADFDRKEQLLQHADGGVAKHPQATPAMQPNAYAGLLVLETTWERNDSGPAISSLE